MKLRELGWEGADWIHLAQDSDSCEHINGLSSSIKGGDVSLQAERL